MALKMATDLENLIKTLIFTNNKIAITNIVYPVGSVYINSSNTNPGSVVGGTWVRVPNGYLRNNGTATGMGTGGSLTSGSTAITLAQMASHVHWFDRNTSNNGHHNHSLALNEDGGFVMYGALNWGSNYTGFRITSGNSNGQSSGASFPLMAVGNGGHVHNVQGDTDSRGSTQGHTHTLEPSFVNIYAWRRTA